MKKIVCFFLSTIFFTHTYTLLAQKTDNELITNISQVTIHLKGAEIIRSKEVLIEGGKSTFIFTGLSPKLNPQSVQVTASNNVQILSITSKINFLKEGKKSNQIELLNDSLAHISGKYQGIEDEKNAFELEKQLLLNNQELKGTNSSLSVDELQNAANFFRQRLRDINTNLSNLKKARKELNIEQGRIKQQLIELNAGKKPTSEIYIAIHSPEAVSSTLKLRYVVDDAGWSPIYDLVAHDLTQDISLKYRALAFNNTGTDWENVKIKLSTADPYQGAGKPRLAPWVLSIQQINSLGIGKLDGRMQLRKEKNIQEYSMSQNVIVPQDKDGKDDQINSNIRFETVEISELNMDFDIKQPYDIPSDFKPYSIEISEHMLSANYKHFAIPKLDKDAFLIAQITGWESLSLISGPMNVYQGEKYVGLANVDTRTISDTLELSLGRDQKVTVKREKRKEFSKNRFLGDKKISSFSYRISIKNNHNMPINLELVDQVPISKNKEISIDIGELSKASHNEESGQLRWDLELSPSESNELNFGYNVKHPKSMEVKMFRSRTMVTPRYF